MGPTQSLVVTLELHVRKDLKDGELIELTRWAWERCDEALRFGEGSPPSTDVEGPIEAEVTVGVVRG